MRANDAPVISGRVVQYRYVPDGTSPLARRFLVDALASCRFERVELQVNRLAVDRYMCVYNSHECFPYVVRTFKV